MTLSGNAYTCSRGETWDKVALSVYGDEKYAADLLCANPHLCTLTVFSGGEQAILPVVEVPEEPEEAEEAEHDTALTAPWKE